MKYIFTIALLVAGMGLMAQNQNQIMKAEYYTNAAVEEFQLSKAQKKTLYKARLDHQVNYSALMKDFKNGNIDEDEKKQKNKELKSNFQQVMMDMTGKDKETLAAFDERVKAEIKALKKKK